MTELPTREQFIAAARAYLDALISQGLDRDGELLLIRAKVARGDHASWSFQRVADIVGAPLQVIVMGFEAHVLKISGKRIEGAAIQ